MQVVQSFWQLSDNFKEKMWSNTADFCPREMWQLNWKPNKANATIASDIAMSYVRVEGASESHIQTPAV